ncbi:M50 family metallopeptidase [Brevibacillus dissolubilis]|uniref:M50 family metallopeptidase n=1 Tax=Brevibacillus dissolubilis TaxID=1844116 RepID=UPI00111672A9|nr:M50 family metallopeptidase [Brevibacillus dissolubilis]
MIERWTGGISIRIHLLFWAVIGLSVAAGYFIETLTLFVIVIIHELGHVAAARELGWRVTEVQLLPFGGVATMEETSFDPLDEVVVALAGPFMNILMIFFSLVFWKLGIWSLEWTQFFMKSNIMIAGFNLLPIWPLDGGRIVQAVLCLILPFRQAVLASFLASSMLAATMLGIGIYFLHLNIIAVASYLIVTNGQAYLRFPFQFIRFLVKKYTHPPNLDKMRSITIPPDSTILQAAERIHKADYHLFYIRGHGGGMLPEEELLQALLYKQKPDWPVLHLL